MKMKPAEIPRKGQEITRFDKKGDRSPGQRGARLPTWRSKDLGRKSWVGLFSIHHCPE